MSERLDTIVDLAKENPALLSANEVASLAVAYWRLKHSLELEAHAHQLTAKQLGDERVENAKLRKLVAELERELESSYDPITDEQVDKLILSATENADERSKNFREFLDWATKEVASWPEWKRNVLGNSMKAQNDTPRRPIVND